MSLVHCLEQEVQVYAGIGYPALLQRFVLKHGQSFTGSKRPKGIRRSTPKACFRNAALLTFAGKGDYYEGYVVCNQLPLPILHAWVVKDEQVIDTTLKDPQVYEYLGIKFSEEQLQIELLRNKVYGLLDIGMINRTLLRTIDNPLVEEALGVRK